MAKSPTELIRELSVELATLTEHDSARQDEILRLYNAIEKESNTRRIEIVELKSAIEKERDARIVAGCENAATKQQLQDHIAQYQEWDRRRWGLIVMLVATVLSLASGLIVTLARK